MKFFFPDSQDLVDPSFNFRLSGDRAVAFGIATTSMRTKCFQKFRITVCWFRRGIVDGFGPGQWPVYPRAASIAF
jgi:hypothetical protein